MTERKLQELPQIVYHATSSDNESSLRKIDLDKGRSNLDFGKGFYVTSSYEQADYWSKKKASFVNSQLANKQSLSEESEKLSKEEKTIRGVKPLIIKYEVDTESLKMMKGKVFHYPNEEWAEFIYENRTNKIKPNQSYVYGRVADSRIAYPLMMYQQGKITFDQFYKKICPNFKYKDDQLCFNTYESLKCLRRKED